MNTPGISGQSNPDKEEGKSAEGSPDNKRPENTQENLGARLDHAIEETFPTSDPVSVTITKGPEPDHPDREPSSLSAANQQGKPEQGSTEQVLDQCGKPCPTLPTKRREQPETCTTEASTTPDKPENGIRRQSGTFVKASEP